MSRSFRLTFAVYLLGLAGALVCDRHLDGASRVADRPVAEQVATGMTRDLR